jgi:hypothetical protein
MNIFEGLFLFLAICGLAFMYLVESLIEGGGDEN